MTPDFYVVGAQKSGTTSLCSILSTHPDVCFSVPKEPMFLCRDDPMLHPTFFVERGREWMGFDWERSRNDLIQGYERLFENAGKHQLCGEGSTTYMLSKDAPSRIYAMNPQAKIIFILRNPVNRAYSAYWHYVREGMVSWGFEREIKFNPHRILPSGCYKRYIERYLQIFPREQIFIGLSEVFKSNKNGFVGPVLEFLGLDPRRHIEIKERRNVAKVPASLPLQLFLNCLYKVAGGQFSAEDRRDVFHDAELNVFQKRMLRIIMLMQKVNLKNKRYPPMNSRVKQALTEYYRRENKGLAELVGIDLEKYWGMSL